jgi:hypothetical protein
MRNKVVLHFIGGRIRKGTSEDFFPNKDRFHFQDNDQPGIHQIRVADLKAIFFVKTFEGRPEYNECHDIERSGFGRRIKVCFKDGETQIGYTQGFSPGRPGFFVFPADPDSNNERIFVSASATSQIELL